MLGIDYTLIIETTDEPDFFSFFSPDLEGFTGVGHSIEDCIYSARHGMRECSVPVSLSAFWRS